MKKVRSAGFGIFILSFCIFCLGTGCASEPKELISGHFKGNGVELYLECYGTGTPGIVVQSGLNGYGSEGEWGKVIEQMSKTNRICIYDRAHLGKSEKLVAPTTVNDTATQLHDVLNNAGVSPPYIMVGHSYGSYGVKAYHHLYPSEVAGVLLVDPSQYGQWTNRIGKWKPEREKYTKSQESSRLEELSYWNDPSKNVSFYDLKVNEKIVADSGDFGNTPVIILWANEGIWQPGSSEGKSQVWQRMKDLYLNAIKNMHKLSTNMKVQYADTREHNMYYHEPDSVVRSLKELLNAQPQGDNN